MVYTLTGNGQTYNSTTNPTYDPTFKTWRFVDTTGKTINLLDMTGNTFTISGTHYPTLTAMQYNLCFTIKEEQLMEALASPAGIPANSGLLGGNNAAIPQDPIITVIWARFQRLLQTNSTIDMNIPSVKEHLDYLSAPTAPTPVVLAAGREAQVLAGIPQ